MRNDRILGRDEEILGLKLKYKVANWQNKLPEIYIDANRKLRDFENPL
jgi:hypothetical protein